MMRQRIGHALSWDLGDWMLFLVAILLIVAGYAFLFALFRSAIRQKAGDGDDNDPRTYLIWFTFGPGLLFYFGLHLLLTGE
jgi:hypothetical protein